MVVLTYLTTCKMHYLALSPNNALTPFGRVHAAIILRYLPVPRSSAKIIS